MCAFFRDWTHRTTFFNKHDDFKCDKKMCGIKRQLQKAVAFCWDTPRFSEINVSLFLL